MVSKDPLIKALSHTQECHCLSNRLKIYKPPILTVLNTVHAQGGVGQMSESDNTGVIS